MTALLPEDVFSAFDASISADSRRDPMGMQTIWSAVGQRIFGNRITSVTNDLRSFTTNLFNHYVVRKLLETDLQLRNRQIELLGHADLRTTMIYTHVASKNIHGVVSPLDKNAPE